MQRDFLEQLLSFLTDEEQRKNLVQQIMDKHGEGIETLKANNDTLTSQLESKNTELTTANELITSLKKTNKGNEDLQAKITDYDTKMAQLQAKLEEVEVENAIKVGLLANKAKPEDLDYLIFKIKQNNADLKLDEQGEVKGIDFKDIKSAYPSNFEVQSKKEVDVNNLPNITDKEITVTKEQFDKMGYSSRVKLREENPEMYNTLAKKN